MTEDDLLTVQQIAGRLGVSETRVRRAIRAGRLPAQRRGARWYVRAADLTAARAALPPGRRQAAAGVLAARLLAVVILEERHGRLDSAQLADAWGVNRRTIQRDMQRAIVMRRELDGMLASAEELM